MKVIDPSGSPSFQIPDDSNNKSAADLVRKKLDSIYNQEPDAVDEAIESIQEAPKERSKHQKFMANLASSGKTFAEIQTEWHNYYVNLPDKEKHDVWNEFYSAQSKVPDHVNEKNDSKPEHTHPIVTGAIEAPKTNKHPETVAELKKQITSKVRSREKLSKSQNIKSAIFGLSVGGFTVFLMLFGFFNERFIAPFITPSKNVSSTPLISDSVSGAVGSDPKLIIPKINVELPVVYDVKTVEENDVQEGLERGVVHYATTSNPGELGNGAIFGHSSNNILNKGKYKFAFVLLNRLEDGDTFYIEKDGIRYVYKIFRKEVVSPDNVSVLNTIPGKDSTMALITCDPPGTTINRLVVWGEQISPDPVNNLASTAVEQPSTPETLAGNPESLWSRMWNSIF